MAELITKADLLITKTDLMQELHNSFELLTLRLTMRFGVIMVVWVATAAIILKPARHSPSWINCLL